MKLSIRLALVLSLSLTVLCARAFNVITVAPNTTNEIFGTKGDCPQNTGDNIYDLQGDSTLLCNKKSQTGFNLWASVICTNGPATLVVGEGVNQFDAKYNFIVRAPGSLTIKTLGCKNFFFGHDVNGAAPTVNFAQYDFSCLEDVVGADGNPLTPTYFALSRAGTLFGFPPSHVPFTVNAAAKIAIPRAGVLTNDTIVLSPASGFQANLLLLDDQAITSSQTITLAANRTIGLRPCEQIPDFATSQTLAWTMKAGGNFNFNVEGVDTTVLYSSCSRDVTFSGKVTGAVELLTDLSDTSWAKMKFSCTGDLTEWTGRARLGSGEKLFLNAANVTHAILWDQSELSFAGVQTAVNIGLVEGRTGASQTKQQCVKAAAGQTISIKSVTGSLVLKGDPETTDDAIDVAAGGETSAFLTDDGTATVTFDGEPEPADGLTLPTASANRYWFLPSSEGLVSSPASWMKPPASNNWYVVRGDVTVDTLPLGYGLRRAEGDSGTTTIRAGKGTPSVVGVHAGESVVVTTPVYDWRTKAILWLDPSQEDRFVWVRQNDDDTSAILTGSYVGETCNTFRGLIDPRSEGGLGLRAWQSRSWMNYTTKGYENLPSIHPMRAKKFAPAADLAYISFGAAGGSRRIQFQNWTEVMTGLSSYTAGFSKVNAKFVVMVFGSQDGGGSAMFASDGYFKRTGKTLADPMLNKTIDVWTNGVKVADSKTAPFSGGWDVFSVDTSGCGGLTILGGNATNDSGGHYLGEMLFFDEVLSDADRREVELYLANKWGLASKYGGGDNRGLATLAGSGNVAVKAGSDVRLGGSFSGTLTLGADAEVSLAAGAILKVG